MDSETMTYNEWINTAVFTSDIDSYINDSFYDRKARGYVMADMSHMEIVYGHCSSGNGYMVTVENESQIIKDYFEALKFLWNRHSRYNYGQPPVE